MADVTPNAGAVTDSGSTGESSGEGSQGTVENQQGQVEQKQDQQVPRKFKVKYNDVEEEVDEQTLITGYQTRKASDQKFQEAAQMRQQAEQFIRLLKEDPIKVLSHPALGHDLRKLSEEYLAKQLQDELMDPKDREIRNMKQQLQEIEEQKKIRAQEEELARHRELRQKYTDDYTKSITEALDKSGLPKSQVTVARMAYYMQMALQRGLDAPADQIVELVKQDYINEQKALYGALDGDVLIQLLGEELTNKIRKYDVAKLKTPQAPKIGVDVKKSDDTPSSKAKKLSKNQWKEQLQKIKDGVE